ncbi:MAG: type II secretion system protein [Deltaproteobacteria bacterium]|nr:MAG: type II secretion system protein [Deltaproteobacteria bacterium]
MTLIEVLVGLLIVAGLLAMVVPAVTARAGVRVQEEAGRLAGSIRYLYNYAAIHGQTCRIAFSLAPSREGSEESASAYRFECTEGNPRLKPEQTQVRDGRIEEEEEEPVDETQLSEEERFQRRIEAGPRWSELSGGLAKTVELPPGVSIRGIWTPQLSDVVSAGETWLYFFPIGETQRALIWIGDPYDNVYTLSVQPLTGRVRVFPEALEVPRD